MIRFHWSNQEQFVKLDGINWTKINGIWGIQLFGHFLGVVDVA